VARTAASRLVRLILATILAGACSPHPDLATTKQQIMEADLSFARATAEHGADGWAAWFAEDGQQFTERGIIRGRAAVRGHMAPVLADSTFRLDWHPTQAEAAVSGELGWTVGRWEASHRGPAGSKAVTGTGNYVTLWKRQADGSWKVALDIGNSDPQPADSTAH
jgi:ketosteroid isomerase-like protein